MIASHHGRPRTAGGRKREGWVKRSERELPLISIITVALNPGERLRHVIQEVSAQTYPNREHIVIDGGSTDGSLDILAAHDGEVDYWVSGPDHGIYEAMDKGIDAADGAWLYFLGVDDAFYGRDTLSSIFEGRTLPEGLDLIVGHVHTDRGMFKSRFNGSLYVKNTVHHQGAFYARHVFDGFRYCGRPSFDRQMRYYNISGDYRLNLMLYRRGAACMRLNRPVSRCQSGVSMQGRLKGYLEEISIRHEMIGFWKALFFDFWTLARYLCKNAARSVAVRRRHRQA